jgi:hypothetical protein
MHVRQRLKTVDRNFLSHMISVKRCGESESVHAISCDPWKNGRLCRVWPRLTRMRAFSKYGTSGYTSHRGTPLLFDIVSMPQLCNSPSRRALQCRLSSRECHVGWSGSRSLRNCVVIVRSLVRYRTTVDALLSSRHAMKYNQKCRNYQM